MAEQRIHRQPRISVNGLTQYLSANAGRRERILHEQKYPPVFRTRWYEHASRAIIRFLLDSDREIDDLVAAEERIRLIGGEDRNERQKIRDNADAVAGFGACFRNINLDTLIPRRGPEQGNSVVEGVTISVRPEVVLAGEYRGANCVGGIKLYFSKNERLGDGSETVASMVHLFMEQLAPENHGCNLRHCMVVDIFGRECGTAPRAIRRRRSEVEAACREIAQRWPLI